MAQTYRNIDVIKLSWPILADMLLRNLASYISIVILAGYSENAVAATSVCSQITYLLIIFYMVAGTGLTTVLSRSLGADRNDKVVGEIISSSLLLNLVVGLLLGGGLFLFSERILRAMGILGEVLNYATIYLNIVVLFSFILSLSVVYSSVIRSFKKSQVTMVIMVVVNIVNVLGAWLAVYPLFGLPQTGIVGVAVATIFSQMCGLLLQYFYVSYGLRVKLRLPPSIKNCPEIKDVFRVGIPSAFEILASHTGQLTITSITSWLGTDALITRTYLQNIIMFVTMISLSIGQATQIITAHLVGAGKQIEIYGRCRKNAQFTLFTVALISVIIAVNGEQVLRLYTANNTMVMLGKSLLFATIFLECGRALNIVFVQALKGIGDARYPALLSIGTIWGLGVLFSYILGVKFEFGLMGIWFAMVMDEWVRGFILWHRLRFNQSQALMANPQASH